MLLPKHVSGVLRGARRAVAPQVIQQVLPSGSDCEDYQYRCLCSETSACCNDGSGGHTPQQCVCNTLGEASCERTA